MRILSITGFCGVLLLLTPHSAHPQQHGHTPGAGAAPTAGIPLHPNLGAHHYAITTRVPEAQRYFDQGIRLTWAFNHEEAIRSFAEGERLDPTCAMCAWGVAYALGPNINAAMDSANGVRAWRAIERARARSRDVAPRERALIEALARRYSPIPSPDRASLDSAFATAMQGVADRYPDDREAQVIRADALMNLAPWHYWEDNGHPRPGTSEILQRLERTMAADRNHPGACHLYIHAVEARDPARALPCAERLAALMPGAGHLVHMPAHIYIRVGRYADAIAANRNAVHADEELIEGRARAGETRGGERNAYAVSYYPHNWHFMSFAASMAGDSRTALESARRAERRLDEVQGALVPWTEVVTPIVPMTLLTFGRWHEILAEPLPSSRVPFRVAMVQHARGVAHAALGNRTAALAALRQLQAMQGTMPAGDQATAVRIAAHALEGEIALRGGDAQSAVRRFEEAVKLEDTLGYNEPPTWFYPMRHALGKALLAARRPSAAEQVYREDLRRFPENGWSLFGLALSLEAQRKTFEARAVGARFAQAWKGADVKLAASRF